MIRAAARRRARVDAAVAAYTQWRFERDAVRAATTYAGLMSRVSGGDRPRASAGARAGALGRVVAR